MKKFVWLGSALVCVLPLLAGAKQEQDPQKLPFDGMSAIDIEVAAALSSPGINASGTPESISATAGPDFYQCDLVETKGRAGHEGDFAIPGNPLAGEVTALVVFTAYTQETQFRLETPAGSFLQDIELVPLPGQSISTTYDGSFLLPAESFRIAASGLDLDNQPFDRACERVFTPQTVEIRFDKEIIDAVPGPFETGAIVTNHGPAQSFQLEVTNSLDLDSGGTPELIELAEGASMPVTINLDIPAISSGVLDIQVIATVTSLADPAVQNSADTAIRVEHFEHVFQDSYE